MSEYELRIESQVYKELRGECNKGELQTIRGEKFKRTFMKSEKRKRERESCNSPMPGRRSGAASKKHRV